MTSFLRQFLQKKPPAILCVSCHGSKIQIYGWTLTITGLKYRSIAIQFDKKHITKQAVAFLSLKGKLPLPKMRKLFVKFGKGLSSKTKMAVAPPPKMQDVPGSFENHLKEPVSSPTVVKVLKPQYRENDVFVLIGEHFQITLPNKATGKYEWTDLYGRYESVLAIKSFGSYPMKVKVLKGTLTSGIRRMM